MHGADHLDPQRCAGVGPRYSRQLRHLADAGAGAGPARRFWSSIAAGYRAAACAPEVLATLTRRGHVTIPGEDWIMRVGGMQGVMRDPSTGLMSGGCDPRRDGYVVP